MEATDLRIAPLSVDEIDLLEPLVDEFVVSQRRLSFREDYWPAFREWILRARDESSHLIRVARVADRVAGLIVARIEQNGPLLVPDRIGYVSMLVVAPDFRRRGIGERLWDTARQWLTTQGISEVQLYTEIGNEAAAGFWNRIGFTTFLERRKAHI